MTDLHSAWRSTEESPKEEIPVSVHAANASKAETVPTAHVRVDPSMKGSMRFAAFTGIGLVTLSMVTFYFGVDFLRASLTDTEAKTVFITQNDVFEPTDITVRPGDTISLVNENDDPQVIKIKDQNELFPVQVLLPGNEYSFDIPLDAESATYVYFSETLPEDRSFTINVRNAADAEAPSEFEDDILIPSFEDMTPAVSSSSSSVTSHAAAPVQNDQSSSVQKNPFEGSAALPTNPYTVGNKQTTRVQQSSLHGGAPLNPPRGTYTTETGPGMWLAGLAALASVGVIAWRQKHVQ